MPCVETCMYDLLHEQDHLIFRHGQGRYSLIFKLSLYDFITRQMTINVPIECTTNQIAELNADKCQSTKNKCPSMQACMYIYTLYIIIYIIIIILGEPRVVGVVTDVEALEVLVEPGTIEIFCGQPNNILCYN